MNPLVDKAIRGRGVADGAATASGCTHALSARPAHSALAVLTIFMSFSVACDVGIVVPTVTHPITFSNERHASTSLHTVMALTPALTPTLDTAQLNTTHLSIFSIMNNIIKTMSTRRNTIKM